MTNEFKTTHTPVLKKLGFDARAEKNIDQGERAISLATGSYLVYKSLKNIINHPLMGLHGIAAGGYLIYRGATGVCPIYTKIGKDTTDPQAINITENIVVNAPRTKVYEFWRELANLPKFMTHLKSVEETGYGGSQWIANTPGNLIGLKWNAAITREEDDTYIGWQSVEGSMIDNAGKIEFKDSLNGTGTEIHIEIDYFPPAGTIGRGIASLFTGLFEKMIREDVQNFKLYVESEDFKHYAGLS